MENFHLMVSKTTVLSTFLSAPKAFPGSTLLLQLNFNRFLYSRLLVLVVDSLLISSKKYLHEDYWETMRTSPGMGL